MDLVAEAVGERRAQRAVDEAGGEGGGVGRTTLTAEERTRDLAGGVGALLDVDGQREEVDAVADPLRSGGRDEHGGVADTGGDGTVGEAGELAGLEHNGLVGPAVRARHGDGFSHVFLQLIWPGTPPTHGPGSRHDGRIVRRARSGQTPDFDVPVSLDPVWLMRTGEVVAAEFP